MNGIKFVIPVIGDGEGIHIDLTNGVFQIPVAAAVGRTGHINGGGNVRTRSIRYILQKCLPFFRSSCGTTIHHHICIVGKMFSHYSEFRSVLNITGTDNQSGIIPVGHNMDSIIFIIFAFHIFFDVRHGIGGICIQNKYVSTFTDFGNKHVFICGGRVDDHQFFAVFFSFRFFFPCRNRFFLRLFCRLFRICFDLIGNFIGRNFFRFRFISGNIPLNGNHFITVFDNDGVGIIEVKFVAVCNIPGHGHIIFVGSKVVCAFHRDHIFVIFSLCFFAFNSFCLFFRTDDGLIAEHDTIRSCRNSNFFQFFSNIFSGFFRFLLILIFRFFRGKVSRLDGCRRLKKHSFFQSYDSDVFFSFLRHKTPVLSYLFESIFFFTKTQNKSTTRQNPAEKVSLSAGHFQSA